LETATQHINSNSKAKIKNQNNLKFKDHNQSNQALIKTSITCNLFSFGVALILFFDI